MPKYKLAYQRILKLKEKRRQFAFIQMAGGALEYYDLFSLGFLFLHLLQVYNGHWLLVHGFTIITLTSYLFRPIGYRLYIWLTHHFTRRQVIHISSLANIFSIGSITLINISETHIYLTLFNILLTRIIHGITFGIRTQASLLYIKANFPDRQHFPIVGAVIGSQLGLSAAILINKFVVNFFTTQQMIWAWKIPFLVSVMFSILLYIIRLLFYSITPNKIDYLSHPSISELALKNKTTTILALLIASARGAITFSLFLILPSILYWRLGWHYKDITNLMLAPTITNTLVTWGLRRYKIKLQLNPNYIMFSLIILIPVVFMLRFAMTDGGTFLLLPVMSVLAIINGFLFIAIPRYLEQVLSDEVKLESFIFIHNYEYFAFNLFRAIILLLAATVFNLPFNLTIHLDLLIVSIWIFLLLAIAAIYIQIKRL